MDLIETGNIEIKDPEIRERDLESSRSSYTHHYVAMEDGKEVGLLSVEFGNEWLVAECMDKKWFKQKKLEAWYRRHGYEINAEHANSPFVKLLSAE